MNVVMIPKTFYRDHAVERELPAPPVRFETGRHYAIDIDHPDMAELEDDARHYADPTAIDCEPWLRAAARGLLARVAKERTTDGIDG